MSTCISIVTDTDHLFRKLYKYLRFTVIFFVISSIFHNISTVQTHIQQNIHVQTYANVVYGIGTDCT